MTDAEEMQMLRLEKRAAELVADNMRLRKRCEDLHRMHEAAQRHIGRLQAQMRRAAINIANEAYGQRGQ